MGTAITLGNEYLEVEIDKVVARLDVYYSLYHVGKVKCITLKRLINTKEEELKLLQRLHDELQNID